MKTLLIAAMTTLMVIGAALSDGFIPGPKFVKTERTVVIFDSPGGNIFDFQYKFLTYADSEKDVEVRGKCLSACTLLLGILDPKRVCVAPGAVMGFHQAVKAVPDERNEKGEVTKFHFEESKAATRFLFLFYPKWVKDWIKKNGGLKPLYSKDEGAPMIYMTYDVLRRHFRTCT